jgi:hypothetical protein
LAICHAANIVSLGLPIFVLEQLLTHEQACTAAFSPPVSRRVPNPAHGSPAPYAGVRLAWGS